MPSTADRALVLVGRYARLQVRSHECKQTAHRLFDACEEPRHTGIETYRSGCMATYNDWKNGRRSPDSEWPADQQSWSDLFEDLGFCRPCRLALRAWAHRKAIHRRRASVLGAMKRLGLKHQGITL